MKGLMQGQQLLTSIEAAPLPHRSCCPTRATQGEQNKIANPQGLPTVLVTTNYHSMKQCTNVLCSLDLHWWRNLENLKAETLLWTGCSDVMSSHTSNSWPLLRMSDLQHVLSLTALLCASRLKSSFGESVHLVLGLPLFLLPSTFPSMMVFFCLLMMCPK